MAALVPFWRRERPRPVESTPEARWAAREIAPWGGGRFTDEVAARAIDRRVAQHPTLFRLDIDGPMVRVAPKLNLPPAFEGLRERATLYRDLLEDVVRAFRLELHAPLLFDCNDMPATPEDAPVFGFQKTVGSPAVLLPDVDLVASSYNLAAEVQDPFAWEEKTETAIFVGATTGSWSTEESVRARSLPRLAAAERFRDAERITWELPQVVQCHSPEAEAMIRGLDLGARRRSWREQFAHRVLLSMDGNGATCSRVSIALASRSVLAKYDSAQVLHYFSDLEPGRHYARVSEHADVDALLDDLSARPDAYHAMADESRAFAARHLTRLACHTYVAELLIRYAQALAGEPVEREGASLAGGSATSDLVATGMDGVRRYGSPGGWAGRPRSGWALQGLTLQLAPSLPSDAVAVRVAGVDGLECMRDASGDTATARDGGAIHGVGFAIPRARAGIDLTYEALFADGYASGPRPPGELTRSPTSSALEAVRLSVTRR